MTARALVVASGVLLAATPASAAAAEAPGEAACDRIRLIDVAADVGLRFAYLRGATGHKHLPETMGAGAAWIDFDGDGLIDLYVVQSGAFPPDGSPEAENRLFRNLGDGTFVEVEASGTEDRGYGQGAVAADFDGDGWPDLYVANYGPDRLLRNRGDGTFEDVTTAAGLTAGGWSSSAAFADATGDGRLDLYVTRYLDYDHEADLYCGDLEAGRRDYCDPTLFAGAGDLFFRNLGGGGFREATREAGFGRADGKGLGVAFVDLDGSGFPDVFVANDLTINFLFRNRGDGTFEDVSLVSGAAVNIEGRPEAGMGIAVGDVHGDGLPDLALTHFDVETNTLYRNRGGHFFEDVSTPSGFGLPSFDLLGFGIAFLDLGSRGLLDAYVANGHIFEHPRREHVSHEQRDLILLGDGRGGFTELRCPWIEERLFVGRGLAVADFDNDGRPDIAILNNDGPLQLLRNDSERRGPWLGVELIGRAPNTQGIGARVEIGQGGHRQVRWILAGDSYQSSSDRRALFGLGEHGPAESLEIRWPSGRVQRFHAPPNNRYLRIHADTISPSSRCNGAGEGLSKPIRKEEP